MKLQAAVVALQVISTIDGGSECTVMPAICTFRPERWIKGPHVRRHQTNLRRDRDRADVRGDEHVHMRAESILSILESCSAMEPGNCHDVAGCAPWVDRRLFPLNAPGRRPCECLPRSDLLGPNV